MLFIVVIVVIVVVVVIVVYACFRVEDQKWHLSLERVLEVAIVAFQRAEIADGEVSVERRDTR